MQTKYRGKYPTRIRSVSSGQSNPGRATVTTNNGDKFYVFAEDNNYEMPKCGDEISKYTYTLTQWVAPGTRFVEVWYNRNERSWVVEPRDVDGNPTQSCDYVYGLEAALSIADGMGVPVVRTNTYGERSK